MTSRSKKQSAREQRIEYLLQEIKSAIKQRDNLRKYISENLTNSALARRFNMHERTLEKIINNKTQVKNDEKTHQAAYPDLA